MVKRQSSVYGSLYNTSLSLLNKDIDEDFSYRRCGLYRLAHES